MITLQAKKDFLKRKLRSDAKWSLRALEVIYNKQTSEEKSSDQTIVNNEVGFSGVDAEILSSFFRQYKTRGWLSQKQMELLFKKMPKYWGQIIDLIHKDQWDTLLN